MTDFLKDAIAGMLLRRLTVDSLVRASGGHCREEIPKYLGQLACSAEYLHSIADRICVMEPDQFSESVIQQTLTSVARAYEQVLAEQPAGYQRLLIQPWKGGIRVQ